MNSSVCQPGSFSPAVYGLEVLSLEANLVTNYSGTALSSYRYVSPTVTVTNASFCNVTVTYTHPGQNDSIITEAWLPMNWNNRFQAVGGGGWVAGRFFLSYSSMIGAMADGFATITTDAGIGSATEPSPWALLSPGNVNVYNLQNFGSVALKDEALIGKSLIRSFYGSDPEYSYWTGCSQGGRQGLTMAQQFPEIYDGIIAGAPAIYWTGLAASMQWPQQIMNSLGEYPYNCEINAITNATIAACDGLDGVVDETISDLDACLAAFDPFSLVGTSISCAQLNGTNTTITEAAAAVVNATWFGTMIHSQQLYPGLSPGCDLTGDTSTSYQSGVAATICTAEGCTGNPIYLGTEWLQLFVARNSDFNLDNLTMTEFEDLIHLSTLQYASLIDSSNADLTEFKRRGGKMLTFHGMADNIISTKATEKYYQAVDALVPDIHEFYRLFEVPGLGHCYGGNSDTPIHLFQQLRDWVENGTAPESSAVNLTVSGGIHNRIICPYPQTAQLTNCTDASSADCWSCN